MGPVVVEKQEPVFHARWEGRLFALRRAAGAWRRWNIDATRHAVERVPGPVHLLASYYARQYLGFIDLLVERGLITAAELETGRPTAGEARRTPPLTADMVPLMVSRGVPTSREANGSARFQVGQTVTARQLNPVSHTRLPRYVRGRRGVIVRNHGVFVFPDTNSQYLGEKPQHLYSVRFTARELWGESAPARDSVHLDLWDDYIDGD